jgi:hypothetical protein
MNQLTLKLKLSKQSRKMREMYRSENAIHNFPPTPSDIDYRINPNYFEDLKAFYQIALNDPHICNKDTVFTLKSTLDTEIFGKIDIDDEEFATYEKRIIAAHSIVSCVLDLKEMANDMVCNYILLFIVV